MYFFSMWVDIGEHCRVHCELVSVYGLQNRHKGFRYLSRVIKRTAVVLISRHGREMDNRIRPGWFRKVYFFFGTIV